ncbi:MAG: YggS family pyridoxal phosphate-dependent enzyme, partial [Pseudomonadota bacterium]|nr:YggS family pyridoxal phosphate-dependent enzyme [Pseudomonadota bacterium]
EGKWPDLKARHADIELHLIGPLQTNKTQNAVALFDVIQTLDRPKLARSLAKEMEKADRRLPSYIQINTGEEPQKAGISPREADAFVKACRDDYQLDIAGLMCIPPHNEEASPHFALLADIAARNGLTGLSMGMSADYPLAIEFGATIVRVGSAIFGPRTQTV